MKIAIVAPTPVPFIIGGAEKFLWGLQAALNQLTLHDAELIKVPCRDQEFWPLMEAYERFYRLDLGYFDKVISTKYPAWMVQHPDHDLYMQHACRGVYDLYPCFGKTTKLPGHRALDGLKKIMSDARPGNHLIEPFFSELFELRYRNDLPSGIFKFPGPLTRAAIHFLDSIALSGRNIKKYFAISANVVNRDGYFPPEALVKTIHHPTDIKGLYSRGYDYLFTASRLEDLKRVDLLINAFKKVKADITFKIAGTGGRQDRLIRAAAGDDRIELLGFVPDEELIDLYAGALFVPFIPYDEDYGLITLEAMLSGKAVLTTRDSGGVTELVSHGTDGIITEPTPRKLAGAMTQMIENREETIRMGKTARKNARHINWENTVSNLLDEPVSDGATDISVLTRTGGARRRKKIVMLNDYPICPPERGGEKRIYNLCRNLAAAGIRVTLATLGSHRQRETRLVIEEGASEIIFPRSLAQARQERKLSRELKASANDIGAIDSYRKTPGFLRFLEQETADADILMCEHPYLYGAAREIWDGPMWIDAHNVEADMKNMALPESGKKNAAINRVMETERSCVLDAELLICVSEADVLRFKDLYGSLPETLVIPNGMDFGAAECADTAERKRLRQRLGIEAPAAVFIGSHHGPNNQALRDLCETARMCPDVCFLIVGTVCESIRVKQAPDNMRLLGPLPEKEKNIVLRVSDIALNPVTRGGGTNLKIMEYIAYMLPVLTTQYGVRGFDLEDEDHVWIREPGEFPPALREMTSPEAAPQMRQMAERALLHGRALYDWSVACDPLIDYIASRHFR